MLRSKRSITLAVLVSLALTAIMALVFVPRILREARLEQARPAQTAKAGSEQSHIAGRPVGPVESGGSETIGSPSIDEVSLQEIKNRVTELLEPRPPRPVAEPKQMVVHMHAAPLDSRRLTPGNFEYRGAFRLPTVTGQSSRFSFGGSTLAFRADGDPDGPDDGYPGSLFTVGHDSDQQVAEVSIPEPRYVVDQRGRNLNPAELLQGFGDISDGFIVGQSAGTEPFKIGGLFVAGDRLHWTLYKYYNVDGVRYDSHATASLDLSKPSPQGLWHLGDMNGGGPEWHSYKNAGYIFDVPPERAANDLGGLNLISGLQISTGRQTSSQGPAMYAYRLPKPGTPSGASLDALPLVFYPLGGNEISRHNPADSWEGGAWIKVGRKEGIIICGRKGLGEFYYGEARRNDCTPDKGYHGTPYEPQMLFYDVEQVLEVAKGKTRPWSVEPYQRWTSETPGGGLKEYFFDTCHARVKGVAFDRANALLYIIVHQSK